eukprot:TRINITY_DN150_c0_g2_i1.p1 TRINITY_DN150_c0_g2~~TRINITY_DN150_c0_g2_i1.p1  ORF type:complete len:173 (-),score=53.11 TRINITY_DN150_c0_g2_i1:167-685(-)
MVQGTLKSYNAAKGWGFINYNGSDVFLHYKDIEGPPPKEGDILTFTTAPSEKDPSKLIAKNVTGGTCGGAFQGVVEKFIDFKGYGFILYEGQQIFVYHSDVVDGTALRDGDKVYFDMVPNDKDPSKMMAKNVAGGSGRPWHNKGGGKGDMFSMMMKMMGMGPYGKGKGKGKK